MEIIATMQALLADEGMNSLAPNLSPGIDNRRGFYDCEANHAHLHENAMLELGYWLKWLQEQSVEQVLVAGYSLGASRVAAYARKARSIVKGQFLIAPYVSTAGRACSRLRKALYGTFVR